MRTISLIFLVVFSLASILSGAVRATEDIGKLQANINRLSESGKLEEAIPIAKLLLQAREKELGTENPELAEDLKVLVDLYWAAGQFQLAIPLAERRLEILSANARSSELTTALAHRQVGSLYWEVGRYSEAEDFLRAALKGFESSSPSSQSEIGTTLGYLGDLLRDQGRYEEAERSLLRALQIARDPDVGRGMPIGTVQNSLGRLYRILDRFGEAEKLYQEALDLREKKYGRVHRDVGETLNNLGVLHHLKGRYPTAIAYYQSSIDIKEATLGRDHIEVGRTINNLAAIYRKQKKYSDAENLFRRALEIRLNALGANHAEVGQAYNNLALTLRMKEEFEEAEELYQKALKIREAALGLHHPAVAQSLHNIAAMNRALGRQELAIPLYDRALEILENSLGPEHIEIIGTLMHKARIFVDRGDWVEALKVLQRAASLYRTDQQRTAGGVGRSSSKSRKDLKLADLSLLVRVLYRVSKKEKLQFKRAGHSALVAQDALSSTAGSALSQMAVRAAKNDNALASLVRKRQDLLELWKQLDAKLVAAVSRSAAKRDSAAESKLREKLSKIDSGLAEVDRQLELEFPDYASLSAPNALSLDGIRNNLSVDEALVLLLPVFLLAPLPEETFIWVVTKNDIRWVRSELGPEALQKEVTALRCTMDPSAWGKADCKPFVGDVPENGFPKFDAARAHKLYKSLFGEVEDLIKGKSLLVVPSGPLTKLPFHVLVTKPPPPSGELANIEWLAKRHAITVLPAVSSLQALRGHAKSSKATKDFIGYGNPLLSGLEDRPSHVEAAKLAQKITGCADAIKYRTAALRGTDRLRGVVAPQFGDQRLVIPGEVRMMAPLPETADELCEIARSTGADLERDIHLGAALTEPKLKALSKDGVLADYKVISFSTHGAMAGELFKGKEPGLIMTPPEEASEEDDGYLTASEITELKLDADWVILSACNTAAGQAKSAEALSGLARAFFYAGTRALLVSHWSVYSKASVDLITKTFAFMRENKMIGRAEALQRAMLSVMKQGGRKAHPAYWAPFVVVGEGANYKPVAAVE